MNKSQLDSQSSDTMRNEDDLSPYAMMQPQGFARDITAEDWLDERPETDMSVAVDDRMEPERQGRHSLDDMFEQVQREAAIEDTKKVTFGNGSPNRLLAAEQDRLVTLATIIARIAPVNGSDNVVGFENPRYSFARVIKKRSLNDIDYGDFNLIEAVVKDVEILWEGEKAMSGLSLARNAVLHIVLSDKDMREKAFAGAADWLSECAEAVERSNISLR